MLRKVLLVLFGLLALAGSGFSQTELPAGVQELVKRGRDHNPERYRFALDNGVKIYPTADGKSFYLVWFPPKADKKTVIATMHGSLSYAFDEFFLWKEKAEKHGHGIVALQWWFEGNRPPADYYSPREAYDNLAAALKALKIEKGRALFHGFSRGSANSYYLALFDHAAKNDYFGLVLSNAGGAGEDYPLYREITEGKFGAKPFDGVRWMTFCGARDQNPDRDGCPAMRRSAKFVEKYGGTVKLALEDPNGDHGGFHRNPDNIEKAMELFDKLVK
ncbi:MAG: hypothetical protein JSS81_13965 [Acidobacteria bacterium]|nr:hypothetical protein [Acidobacteriota bacterium]